MTEEQLFQNLRIAEALLFTAQDMMTENDFKSYFEIIFSRAFLPDFT